MSRFPVPLLICLFAWAGVGCSDGRSEPPPAVDMPTESTPNASTLVSPRSQEWPTANRAEFIFERLDLTSFPNSTGPRRQGAERSFADFGVHLTSQSGDHAESDQAGDWFYGLTVKELRDVNADGAMDAIVCFVDRASNGGSYHTGNVLVLELQGTAVVPLDMPPADAAELDPSCSVSPPATEMTIPASTEAFEGYPTRGSDYVGLRGMIGSAQLFTDSLLILDAPNGVVVGRSLGGLFLQGDVAVCTWGWQPTAEHQPCGNGLLETSKEPDGQSLPYFDERTAGDDRWYQVRIGALTGWMRPSQPWWVTSLETRLMETGYAEPIRDRDVRFYATLGGPNQPWSAIGVDLWQMRVDGFEDHEGERYAQVSVYQVSDEELCQEVDRPPNWTGFARLYGDDSKLNFWYAVGGC